MSYPTVANLKDSVSAQLTGLNLNNVKNLFGAFERAARFLSSKIAIPETMGRYNFTTYDGVIEYLAPSDIFGSSLIDIQPQGLTRYPTDYVYKKYISDFDRQKNFLPNGTEVSFEWNNGVPIMRLVSSRPVPKIELDSMSDTTGWTAAGTASGLAQDQTVLYQSPASLRFNLTTGTGTLTKTISRQDLTDYAGVGVGFLAMYIPSSQTLANLTSLSLKIGTDASNYYTVTATQGFLGAFKLGEWLLVAFDLAGATQVGTVTKNNIVYAQISVTAAGAINNLYFGDLWISLPSPQTLLYKTASLFQTAGGSLSKSISGNGDYVVLSDNAYALYEVECALEVASQQGGTLANGVVQQLEQKLNGVRGYRGALIQLGLYDLYRAKNPDQELNIIGNWYD